MASRTRRSAPVAGPARFQRPAMAARSSSVPKAIVASLTLLVLLVGLPVGLWMLTGPPPIPTSIPSRSDLTQPIGLEALLTVFATVVWLAWLLFVLCVFLELASVARGGGLARPIPLSGPLQQLARALVGAALFTGITVGPTAALDIGAQHTITVTQAGAEQAAVEARADDVAQKPAMGVGPGAPLSAPADGESDLVGKKVYVVKAPQGHYHDNLWDIAERHLGDGRRYHEIFRLNEGRIQSDGRRLQLARLIQPGWTLIMPDAAVGVERVTPPDAQADGVDRAVAHAQDGAASAPYAGAGSAPHDDMSAPASQPGTAEEGSAAVLPPELIGGSLLASGLMAALWHERRRRRSSRPEDEAVEAEVALRVGADDDRAAWLDAALRGLFSSCLQARMPLPPVFAARVGEDLIELLLAPAQPQAPPPWVAVDGGRIWTLQRPDGQLTHDGDAPFPALVCLGRDEHDRDMLVDLEAAGGAISISGDTVIAHEVAAAIAVQLATNRWADDLRVTAYSMPPGLAEIAGDRIRLAENLEDVVPEFDASRRQFVEGTDVLTGRLMRGHGIVPDYLVMGAPPPPEMADRIAALSAGGRQAFAAITVGTTAHAPWRIHVDETGTLTLPVLDITAEAVRLRNESVTAVAELFAAARTPEPPDAPGMRLHHLRPARETDDAAWSTAQVRVGVLGPVSVRCPGEIDPSRLPLATEVVSYLAMHSGGVHPNVLAGAIWPHGVTASVRDATIERVRAWLGTDTDGNHHLRLDPTGRLILGPHVVVDWDCVATLVARSRRAQTIREEGELLRRALHLVRGELLADAPAGRYAWIARTQLERLIPDTVVYAAHRLSEILLGGNDPEGASEASRAGLRLSLTEQLLWRDLMQTEHQRAGTLAAAAARDAMADALVARNVEVEPETHALAEELLPHVTGARASAG